MHNAVNFKQAMVYLLHMYTYKFNSSFLCKFNTYCPFCRMSVLVVLSESLCKKSVNSWVYREPFNQALLSLRLMEGGWEMMSVINWDMTWDCSTTTLMLMAGKSEVFYNNKSSSSSSPSPSPPPPPSSSSLSTSSSSSKLYKIITAKIITAKP